MATLSRELRKVLENVVTEAREVAEEAAAKSLEVLAVGEHDAHRGMSAEQKALRNRLRAHGRQLGDARNAAKGTQEIERLVAECAYEHWHRMLFARFLAENQLLLEPESGDVFAIEEVKQLARSRGRDWVVLAGEFAVQMLPQVFRQDDPVLELQLVPEDRKRLEELLEALPEDVFTASDSLGWTYQFWQSKRKDEVNAAGNKIGADELPSVTQLFTEDYMVDFLLDNTLGAWHAGKVLAADLKLAATATSEDELRKAVGLPGCPWKYLRFIRGKDGAWIPGAGTFSGWPHTVKELTCLDPCMGSGHFVVAMFERLVALRAAEESQDEATTVAAVIRDNVFGLEIDPRCTQIGAFNLALAAWRRAGYSVLPAMNLACSGLAPNNREAEWLAIAGKNEKLKNGMARLFQLFKDAPVLGSLINPRAAEGDLFEAGFHELQPLLEKALAQESNDDAAQEMAVTARGLAKAAEILAGQFTLVATNVPYLGRRNQDEVLMDYCKRIYPEAKADLATCFVDRGLEFCVPGASVALVTPQYWFFLGTYEQLRSRLLKEVKWDVVIRLGAHAFETISGEIVNAAMVVLTQQVAPREHELAFIDVVDEQSAANKAYELLVRTPCLALQKAQLSNPDARISVVVNDGKGLLQDLAFSTNGMHGGDFPRFRIFFWELSHLVNSWRFFQSTVDTIAPYAGRQCLFYWPDDGRIHKENEKARVQGGEAWNRLGVAVNLMSNLAATLYSGDMFDMACSPIVPRDPLALPAIWSFCSSPEFNKSVRQVDQKVMVTSGTIVKVPFDRAHWQKVAAEKYPNGLPKPFSSDPTQWLFNGQPAGADQPLHVAVARLLGYQWPRQTGSSFPDCPALGADGLETLTDDDGIVPISPAKGEGPAAERLRELLARAYGKDWNATRQEALLAQVDYAGTSLDAWLRNGFFEQHCALFHHRPFIWHVWDGERDGFHALVNYHKLVAPGDLGTKALEKLTYAYLGDWIGRQRAEQKQGKEGADAKLAAALHLQVELKNIIEGEAPHDLFVRWKPLHQQAIGWEPDINDGVRMNIRPFMMARTLKGKSVFRKAPKIKWEKDRGKEPERLKRDYPWFWGWNEETEDFAGGREFDGNRWNDLHYSLNAKRDARARQPEKKR